jgi:hypothetical protein
MKLTWFGGTALRAYVGGEIVVVDPEAAAGDVEPRELLSGADRVVRLAEGQPQVDAANWRPRPVGRAIDEPVPMEVASIGPLTLLVSAVGDPPLLISNTQELPRLGRWADGAVFVLFGHRGALLGEAMLTLDLARPRHLLLAAEEEIVDGFVTRVAGHLREMSFSSLEPGLALEV